MPNFRVDVVLNTVKSLQYEKSCLEQKLQEMRSQKAELEKTRESTKTKLVQTKEVTAKMNAALKVAEHKVAETQNHLNTLQNTASQRSSKQEKLEREINHAKSQRMKEINQFESLLSDLVTKFQNARSYYNDDNFSERNAESQSNLQKIVETSASFTKDRNNLTDALRHMKLDEDEAAQRSINMELPAEQQQEVLSMFAGAITQRNRFNKQLADSLASLNKRLVDERIDK